MKELTGCLLFLFLVFACSPASFQTIPDTRNAQFLTYHKRLAVLPILVYGRPPNVKREGNLQQHFFETLSRQINRERQQIALQSFIETNEILKSKHISHRTLMQMNKTELCELLGVDAVFAGNLDPGRYVQRGDQGVTMTGQIFDKATGELVWRKELTMLASSVYDTRYKMLVVTTADMARQLPY